MQILNEQYNKVHTWNDEFMNILKWCVHFSSLIWCYVVRGRGLFKHVCVSLIGWFIFCFCTRSRWVYIQCNAVQDVKLCNVIRTVFIKGFYYLLFWIYPRVVQTYCENVQWMCSNTVPLNLLQALFTPPHETFLTWNLMLVYIHFQICQMRWKEHFINPKGGC